MSIERIHGVYESTYKVAYRVRILGPRRGRIVALPELSTVHGQGHQDLATR
jgi:hypothetical protein